MVSVQPDPRLVTAWQQRGKLLAEGHRLLAEDDRLLAEGHRLLAEDDRLLAEGAKLLAEGGKLLAEGDRLLAEGAKLWVEAILQVHGNIKLEWNNWHPKEQSYECHLATGEVFVLGLP